MHRAGHHLDPRRISIARRPSPPCFLARCGSGVLLALTLIGPARAAETSRAERPNILIAIADDMSFPDTSAWGDKAVRTPNFDRVADEGVLFRNGFAGSPGCSPSRAALLTGRHDWQIEQAGTHLGSFPKKYVTYPDLLEAQGYAVGYTGKGWGPGNWKVSGRTRNPAGPVFNEHKLTPPYAGISKVDYAANFEAFLAQRKKGQPFCFWYGAHEPHRGYELDSWKKEGKQLEDASVPKFLPDVPLVRGDLLDYAVEIEWFDSQLGKMLKMLDDAGELDNTIVVVTGDNGMPFPRAKANCYEYGFHVPLAIRWGKVVKGGRTVDDLVGFVDLAPTFLKAGGAEPPAEYPMSGRSIMNILRSEKQGRVDPTRTVAWSSRERHTSARYDNRTYPQRALRTPRFLYIRNFKPDRWPAGAPRLLKADGTLSPQNSGYFDVDRCPTMTMLKAHADDPFLGKYLQLAVARRPAEELFDITKDPDCLHNLAGDSAFEETRAALSKQMTGYLRKTGDPRLHENGDIWDTYKRYSNIRHFPPPSGGEE